MFFGRLEYLKQCAKQTGEPAVHEVELEEGETWPFFVRPHGLRGYPWIMEGAGYVFRFGDQERPGSRPGVMVEFRSDLLWMIGPQKCVEDACAIIEVHDGVPVRSKVSRVDLAVDVLVPASLWNEDLFKLAVCRASSRQFHCLGDTLTGVTIGRGNILCRLYDKDLEIHTKSHKFWMRDIWKLAVRPEDSRIIRIEFQVRREAAKELGLDLIEDLWSRGPEVWRYLTEEWLKFQTNPGAHHTMRKTLGWWETVQGGFAGAQGATRAVRAKAIATRRNALVRQMYGLGITLAAIEKPGRHLQEGRLPTADELVALWDEVLFEEAAQEPSLGDRLKSRMGRISRMKEKQREALKRRREAKRKGGGDA